MSAALRRKAVARLRAVVLGLSVLASSSFATEIFAEPTVGSIGVRGLTIGAAQQLSIDGGELGPDSKLLLAAPLAAQQVAPGASAGRTVFDVTVADSAAPGIYALRVANAKGVSAPTLVAIDRLPNLPFSDKTTATPVALHGRLGGDQRQRTTVVAKKGQLLTAEVECQRLGGGFRPVLRLYDARGVQLAWSGPNATLGGDARLTVAVPADGEYAVEVHDMLFRAGGPGHFRLKLGAIQFVDAVFPSGATAGGVAVLEPRRTSLPSGSRIEFDARTIGVPDVYPAPWAAAAAAGPLSGTAPRVWVSEYPESVEPAAPESGPKPIPAAPSAVHGTLSKAGEEDRYKIPAAAGAKLQLELQAQLNGSPLDGVLTVVGPNGAGLGSSDDRPGTSDPLVEATVPAGADHLIAVVRDLEGRGGADFTYRLVVRDLGRPDVTPTLESDRLAVPAGGVRLVTVPLVRQADTGPIRFELPGLPAGVQVAGETASPAAGFGLISLSAPEGAAPQAVLTSLVARTANGGPPAVRAAMSADFPAARLQPWLRRELAVAVVEPASLNAAWVASAPDEKLTPGGKLPVKLQIRRAAGATGAVRVRLVTNQTIPKKTVKENNKDVQVDDLDKALRLEAPPTIAADAVEATAVLLVPADLPHGAWNLALVAELLSADGKSVVTSAPTVVRTLVCAP